MPKIVHTNDMGVHIMGLLNKLLGLVGMRLVHEEDEYDGPGPGPTTLGYLDEDDQHFQHDDGLVINPANGLPMTGGECGVDTHGNAYGTSSFDDWGGGCGGLGGGGFGGGCGFD